jgi:hypothetical protein
MAKTRKKTKTKKPGKAAKTAKKAQRTKKTRPAKKAPATAKRKPRTALGARLAVADPNAKRLAVINAVNSAMDANHRGWNSDGNGDSRTMSYFGEVVSSIKPFLYIVARLLQPAYTLAVDQMDLAACVSATVVGLKGLVLQKTT